MPTIRISEELFARLESYAKGFDTPSSVIERLLNQLEETSGTSSDDRQEGLGREPSSNKQLIFLPSEDEFRSQLLIHKRARVAISYTDGSTEEKIWNASRFTQTSNLRGNLASGYLRYWSKRGIVKATFQVLDSNA